MAYLLDIKDRDIKGNLAVELTDILGIFAEHGSKLSWSILDLQAIGELGKFGNMLDLERKIQDSPAGVTIIWTDLVALAKCLFDIENIVIAGYNAKDNYLPILTPEHPLQDLYKTCEIVIELFEGTTCSIYVRKKELMETINNKYRDVIIKEIE